MNFHYPPRGEHGRAELRALHMTRAAAGRRQCAGAACGATTCAYQRVNCHNNRQEKDEPKHAEGDGQLGDGETQCAVAVNVTNMRWIFFSWRKNYEIQIQIKIIKKVLSSGATEHLFWQLHGQTDGWTCRNQLVSSFSAFWYTYKTLSIYWICRCYKQPLFLYFVQPLVRLFSEV